MITIERYKSALQDFADMDLGTSRVAFSREEIIIQGEHKWVTVPTIEQKTYKIIQLIQRIFSSIFGDLFCLDSDRLDTAKKLSQLAFEVVNLFRGQQDLLDDAQLGFDLKNEVTQVVWQVLQKIKRACHNEQLREVLHRGQIGVRHGFSEVRRQAVELARSNAEFRLTVEINRARSAIALDRYYRARERARGALERIEEASDSDSD
ncbi:MAG: hypothetical protein PVI40_07915 [Chlamydiota bacterium]|jgi:hypothetical protein